jgi:hypothetical protein
MAAVAFALAAATAHAEDNWEKMKDCGAEAEKLAHRMGRDRKGDKRSNHYSPKYNHCFVKHEWWWNPSDGGLGETYEDL